MLYIIFVLFLERKITRRRDCTVQVALVMMVHHVPLLYSGASVDIVDYVASGGVLVVLFGV